MHHPLYATNVPVPAIGSWRQAANVCGFTLEPVFRDAGIAANDQQPLKVPATRLFKAFQMCVERARGHHFPFALGDSFVFEHFAEFDAFISSCSTLREMLEMAGWARDLVAPWMSLHLDEFGSEAHLRVELNVPGTPDPNGFRHLREVVLSAINQLLRRAAKGTPCLLSVRVSGPAPAHKQEFTDHFGVPVFFDDTADALVMDRRWLDQPLNAFEQAANTQARQQIERRLNREVGERRIVDEVRWALERRPELLREGLESTAAALGLHPRTLQRRLQSEGVKYVDVQSAAKCQRAQTMLKRRAISMESISVELGFSDRRAFTFAFKRWTGLSPSAWRDQLSVGAAAR